MIHLHITKDNCMSKSIKNYQNSLSYFEGLKLNAGVHYLPPKITWLLNCRGGGREGVSPFTTPLYEGADITIFESYLLALQYGTRHSLTKKHLKSCCSWFQFTFLLQHKLQGAAISSIILLICGPRGTEINCPLSLPGKPLVVTLLLLLNGKMRSSNDQWDLH